MSRIFLIGFMGAGKSTAGVLLAGALDLPFIDLDAEIERSVGQSIPEIFASAGEDAFREAEARELRGACEMPDAVVACGGGVVLRDANRALMRSCGEVVYLAVTAEEAIARIGDGSGRPLLSVDSARMARSILDARLSLYRTSAHHVIDTSGRTPAEVVAEIVPIVAGLPVSEIDVRAGAGYTVTIGVGVLDSVGDLVAERTSAKRVALVTDSSVDALFGDDVINSLTTAGIAAQRVVVEAGERSKSWEQAGRVLDAFAEAGLDRSSAVVALGGGVVGDLAGFCAASFMRGIPLVHVPTTLLAQVDSSVGGKTGVDLTAGKNLAGAFWQPSAVITDPSVLQSLPEAEWLNGIVEVVKTVFLQGQEEVARLERDASRILLRDEHAVVDMVHACVRFKADVVSDDEREAGRRECLNFGHTLGHAIENLAGYGTIPHGVAVAEGMRFASRLAEVVLDAPIQTGRRIGTLLGSFGIPRVTHEFTAADLKTAMLADKKNRDSVIRFVLVRSPGDWTVCPVDDKVLDEVIEWWRTGFQEGGIA